MDINVLETKINNIEKSQDSVIDKLDRISDNVASALNRLSILEAKNGDKVEHLLSRDEERNVRITKLEMASQSTSHNIGKALEAIYKIVIAVCIGFILVKLGIKP